MVVNIVYHGETLIMAAPG